MQVGNILALPVLVIMPCRLRLPHGCIYGQWKDSDGKRGIRKRLKEERGTGRKRRWHGCRRQEERD